MSGYGRIGTSYGGGYYADSGGNGGAGTQRPRDNATYVPTQGGGTYAGAGTSTGRRSAFGRLSGCCDTTGVADSHVSRTNRGTGPHVVDPTRFNTSSRLSQLSAHTASALSRALGTDSTTRWSRANGLFTPGNLEARLSEMSPDQTVHYSPFADSMARAMTQQEELARMRTAIDAGLNWPPSEEASPATYSYSPLGGR